MKPDDMLQHGAKRADNHGGTSTSRKIHGRHHVNEGASMATEEIFDQLITLENGRAKRLGACTADDIASAERRARAAADAHQRVVTAREAIEHYLSGRAAKNLNELIRSGNRLAPILLAEFEEAAAEDAVFDDDHQIGVN